MNGAYVKVVQTCTVYIDENLSRAGLRLSCILSYGYLGRVGVFGDYEGAHDGRQ